MKPKLSFAALACAALLAGCERSDTPAAGASPSATSALPALPVAEPPVTREDLLLAVVRAASAAAAGSVDLEQQRELDGKLFSLRLRFGCSGATPASEQPRGWSFDEEARVLRVRVGAEIEGDTPLVASLAGEAFEAVEGFWIRRPWLLQPSCPATAPAPEPEASPAGEDGEGEIPAVPSSAGRDAAPSPEPPLRVGIAQFFTDTDARTHRLDSRAYEATATLGDDERPSPKGYDLVIEGRLQRLPDGRVIACRNEGDAAPPSCLISARFEKVSLERADTGAVIADWPRG